MRILLVDDSPGGMRLLRAVLEGENFTVLEAADGAQALAVLEREAVDGIISDILMPRMDGYRLCQEVRKSEKWQGIPFIFYTATYTSPGDEKLCYDLGGDKYLRKPVSSKVLLAALAEATNMAAKRPANRVASMSESDVMKEYSERLVSKLEEKNQELARRTDQLERAKSDLQQANQELESRVQQRTAQLEAANEELESFAYSVSHDLRAPLRHIGGYANLILKHGAAQMNETSLQHLHLVCASAQKMGETIQAVLELTRVTHGELHPTEVDLSELAREVVAELQADAPGRTVKIDIAEGLMAQGDRRLLRVALMNLLGNAFKFTSHRSDAHIQFGRIENNANSPYFVRDNGVGFDMAYADKLFGAFQRLHSKSDFEGNGIGLATVQRIIRRHHGKTWAESVQNHGSAFYFALGEIATKSDEQYLALEFSYK